MVDLEVTGGILNATVTDWKSKFLDSRMDGSRNDHVTARSVGVRRCEPVKLE